MQHTCPECDHDLECMVVLSANETLSGYTEHLCLCNNCLSTWQITIKEDGSSEIERYFFG